MSEKYKVIDSSIPTFVTMTIIGWVDLFIRPSYSKILDDSLNYCIEAKGLKVHAYVYMTSHIHLILSSEGNEIQNIIRDFKKHTNKKFIEEINSVSESRRVWLLNKFSYEARRTNRADHYKIWQDGFHPILLDNYKKIEQRIHYIHYNPIAAGFVYHERDWKNSSYSSYEEGNREISNVKVSPLW
ncbi:REP-associated tyrosine transposase [Moheibacter stercoris]|uniref:REP element-mobilizing transposase RayT n=1 Tax=Moheibacter stercoris TaxID=1628251 RepID=A0ABV2LVW6_9FLAO